MTELESGTSAERSIGEKSGLGVWLLSAITAAVIAGGKRRSWGGWLLLGLLLGVFAVVMVAFLPAVDRRARDNALLRPMDMSKLRKRGERPGRRRGDAGE